MDVTLEDFGVDCSRFSLNDPCLLPHQWDQQVSASVGTSENVVRKHDNV